MAITKYALTYSVCLAAACYLSYFAAFHALSFEHWASAGDMSLGGMWAAVAAIFVLRPSEQQSRTAIASRSVATISSAICCLVYLAFFVPSPMGLAVVVGIGTLLLVLIGRGAEVITAGITTAVIFVVAMMSGGSAWKQPILRLLDTTIGVLVGWLASHVLGVVSHVLERHDAPSAWGTWRRPRGL